MVSFKLESGNVVTEEERKILAAAKEMPIVYDEDSPKLTDEMENAFREARVKKPYKGERLTVYVSHPTIAKDKNG